MSNLFFNVLKANSIIFFIISSCLLMEFTFSLEDDSLKIQDGKNTPN